MNREQLPARRDRAGVYQVTTAPLARPDPRPRSQTVTVRPINRPVQRVNRQGVVPPMWWETRRGRRTAAVVATVTVLVVAGAGWWVHANLDLIAQLLVATVLVLLLVAGISRLFHSGGSGCCCPWCRGRG